MPKRTQIVERYSTIIIGSGAGGATAFLELSSKVGTILVEEGSDTASLVNSTPRSEVFAKLYRNSGIRPAIGSPTIALGEGRCLGGSTEINGGLFWRTPGFILKKWRDKEIELAFGDKLSEIFNELEDELSVQDEVPVDGYDIDSQILFRACKHKNWKVVPARRMAPGCKKSNICPLGCPTGAKKSMSTTFIPKAIDRGGKVLTGWRAVKIRPKLHEIEVHFENIDKKRMILIAPNIILSCGAIESRRLLQQSGLIKQRIGKIGFHLNAKVIVEFPQKVDSEKGTIFNYQLQEFIEDGFLLMSSNFNPTFLAMASTYLDHKYYEQYRERSENLAIYTLQFNPNSKIIDLHLRRKSFLLFSFLEQREISRIRRYLQLTAELLFEAGAKSIKLPFQEQPPVYSKQEAMAQIFHTPKSKFNLTSVHLMSSLPLPGKGDQQSPLDGFGRLKRDKRIRVLDASILPTNIGESPQGSIMALVRYLIRNETP